jgi:DNA polymerase-3 subunit alpha
MNYTAYHVHTSLSLMDSCTSYASYIEKAQALGQTAIAFTEHGKPLQWVKKKMACDAAGIKYMHGVECYLTKALQQRDPETGEWGKARDNYHTILIARDYQGVLEINQATTTTRTDCRSTSSVGCQATLSRPVLVWRRRSTGWRQTTPGSSD